MSSAALAALAVVGCGLVLASLAILLAVAARANAPQTPQSPPRSQAVPAPAASVGDATGAQAQSSNSDQASAKTKEKAHATSSKGKKKTAAVTTGGGSGGGGFGGGKIFAPYLPLDMVNYSFDMAGGPSKFYTLAFVLADSAGRPSWNGDQPLAQPAVSRAIAALRAKGGDVIVSCGGASGSELGFVIKDAARLQAAYQQVLDAYGVRWLDLDIEGGTLEPATVDSRNRAIAALQKANPGLRVSYTLSADTNGVNAPSRDLLANAKKRGVRVDCVNGMLMEMHSNDAANVIAGAKAVKAQCDALGLRASVGICPMVGVNDSGGPFGLDDARAVAAFANATPWVGLLTFWSVARDNGSCAGKKQADGACSGLAQARYAFCAAMRL